MKYFIAASILFAGLLPGIAKADLIPDNYHVVETCLTVDNLSAYPEYDFALSWSSRFDFPSLITEGENCHINGTATILAIKKTDSDDVTYARKGTIHDGDGSFNPANASLFITSGLSLSFPDTIPDTDPAVSKKYTVHIDDVSADAVQARLIDTDVTNAEARTASSMLVVTVVIVALGVLGLGLAYRTWKK